MNTTTNLAGAARRAGEAGDAAAARAARAAVYERVIRRIHAYFRRLVRDPAEAEECLSRALLELERTLAPEALGGAAGSAGYDPGRSFNTWMWLKAHSVYAQWCRERARDRRAEPLGEREPAAPEAADGARALERRLDAATLLGAIEARLGRETLEAFLLFHEGGLTRSEVAEALGRDRGTITRRLEDAHALLDRLRASPT